MDFNEPTLRRPYELFEGRIAHQMPLLIADRRVPASVANILERRINSDNPNWKANHLYTGDMFVNHPDGKFKVVCDAQLLRELNPQTRLIDGVIHLPDGLYEKLEGTEFRRDSFIFDNDLTAEDAKTHPVWRYVARDEALLVAYVDAMFPEMERFGFDKAMGVYLPVSPKNPQARAFYIGGLGGRSRLSGGVLLDNSYGLVVGVASELVS